MIHFVKVGFVPGECEFVSKLASFTPLLAVAELALEDSPNTGVVHLLKVEQVSAKFDQTQVV